MRQRQQCFACTVLVATGFFAIATTGSSSPDVDDAMYALVDLAVEYSDVLSIVDDLDVPAAGQPMGGGRTSGSSSMNVRPFFCSTLQRITKKKKNTIVNSGPQWYTLLVHTLRT